MKTLGLNLYMCVVSLLLLNQCSVLTTPPTDPPPTKENTEVTGDGTKDTTGGEDVEEGSTGEEIVEVPLVNNPLLTPLEGDPLKNGHPNLEPDLTGQTTPNASSSSGADAYLGQIKMFAGNFAPRGWAFCEGQILAINDNQSLYSLLGTSYGGDGRTTFALPDLRGRAPIHVGKTVGGVPAEYKLGKRYGNAKANTYKTDYQNKTELKKLMQLSDGVNVPTTGVETQPTLGIHYIIAVSGIFPSRS